METEAIAAFDLLSRMRFACGDNGKRMQDELEEYLRDLKRDADRWRDITAGIDADQVVAASVKFGDARGVLKDAGRWRAMRQTLVAADFAPEMGGGPVVMFACHAERVGFGPEGADAIADAAVAAMNGANA